MQLSAHMTTQLVTPLVCVLLLAGTARADHCTSQTCAVMDGESIDHALERARKKTRVGGAMLALAILHTALAIGFGIQYLDRDHNNDINLDRLAPFAVAVVNAVGAGIGVATAAPLLARGSAHTALLKELRVGVSVAPTAPGSAGAVLYGGASF
jgi:hypothetical protein